MSPLSRLAGCSDGSILLRSATFSYSATIRAAAGGLTGGSFLVRDADDTGLDDEPFVWREEWCLITVINPENGRRLLIDGNKRALALWAQRQSGEAALGHVGLITGELMQPVIFIGKALSPLWR